MADAQCSARSEFCRWSGPESARAAHEETCAFKMVQPELRALLDRVHALESEVRNFNPSSPILSQPIMISRREPVRPIVAQSYSSASPSPSPVSSSISVSPASASSLQTSMPASPIAVPASRAPFSLISTEESTTLVIASSPAPVVVSSTVTHGGPPPPPPPAAPPAPHPHHTPPTHHTHHSSIQHAPPRYAKDPHATSSTHHASAAREAPAPQAPALSAAELSRAFAALKPVEEDVPVSGSSDVIGDQPVSMGSQLTSELESRVTALRPQQENVAAEDPAIQAERMRKIRERQAAEEAEFKRRHDEAERQKQATLNAMRAADEERRARLLGSAQPSSAYTPNSTSASYAGPHAAPASPYYSGVAPAANFAVPNPTYG